MQNLGSVQESIEAALGFHGVERPPPPALPGVPWHPHATPRAHVYVDRESQSTACAVVYKVQRGPMDTPGTWLQKIQVRRRYALCMLRAVGNSLTVHSALCFHNT